MTTITDIAPRSMGLRVRLAVVAAPERILLVVVALAIAAGATVTAGIHYPWTTLPLAIALVACGWKALAPATDVGRAHVTGAVALLLAVTAWTVWNIAMAAEFVLVLRDPGFLTLSGMWLVDHPHTDIPTGGTIEAAALQSSLLADASQAWNLRGEAIQPQGAKMLPATIAIGGWLAGTTGVLSANIVIGAVGLVAVYALARRFLGPLASLAPTAALGLTVAHIALSRAAYSEPLTLLLIMVGVMWAWRGIATHRVAPLVAAALASGATSFVRIDGAAFAVGALAGVMVGLALSQTDAAWRQRAALIFVVVQSATVLAGYASLWRWSEAYVERLEDSTRSLVLVFAVVATVSLLWAVTWGARLGGDKFVSATADRLGRRGAMVVGAAVSLGLAILASRPLWTVVHRGTEADNHVFVNQVVAGFQRAEGLPEEPTRTYAEHTVTWLSYYLTWPLVILGIIGFGIIAYRMLYRDRGWAVFLGAILAPTLLYLWNPSIVPDQIWAIRRFEAATLPGFALAAAVALWVLTARLRKADSRLVARKFAAALMVLAPLSSWLSVIPDDEWPVRTATPVTTREMLGARDQLDELCAIADGRPIILAGTSEHFGALRVWCDSPVVLALNAPTEESLQALAVMWDEPPVVLTRSPDWFTWTTEPLPVVESRVTHAAYALQRIPRETVQRTYTWRAGVLTDTGELVPVQPLSIDVP